MNSIDVHLWDSIELAVGTEQFGPTGYMQIIAKIQLSNLSAVRELVKRIEGMNIVRHPGQNVESFCDKLTKLYCLVDGTGSAL